MELFRTFVLLPPAYVVQREGNSFTLFVSPHLGGAVPISIMLCNISQNAMGQTPAGGGVPCQVQPGGDRGYPAGGGGGYPAWGVPGKVPPPARSGQGGYPVMTT